MTPSHQFPLDTSSSQLFKITVRAAATSSAGTRGGLRQETGAANAPQFRRRDNFHIVCTGLVDLLFQFKEGHTKLKGIKSFITSNQCLSFITNRIQSSWGLRLFDDGIHYLANFWAEKRTRREERRYDLMSCK